MAGTDFYRSGKRLEGKKLQERLGIGETLEFDRLWDGSRGSGQFGLNVTAEILRFAQDDTVSFVRTTARLVVAR
jgi:hypothetical protein